VSRSRVPKPPVTSKRRWVLRGKGVLAYPCLAIAELVGGDHLEQIFLVRVGDAPSRPVML
jgi:hypothetical protein